MSQLMRIAGGVTTPRQAAAQIERALAGCRRVAASHGLQFLSYLIGMSAEEARTEAHKGSEAAISLSDRDICRYIADALGDLQPMVQRHSLRTLAYMIEHVRSEADESARRECLHG